MTNVNKDEWVTKKTKNAIHDGTNPSNACDYIENRVIFISLNIFNKIDVHFCYLCVSFLFADLFDNRCYFYWIHNCISFLNIYALNLNILVLKCNPVELLGNILIFLNYFGRFCVQCYWHETVIAYYHWFCLIKFSWEHAVLK